MKKWMKISLIVLLVTSVTGLLAFVGSRPSNMDCNNVHVVIKGNPETMFVTEDEIIQNFQAFCSEAGSEGPDLKKIEQHINHVPSVKTSDIYKNVNGSITIEVELRTVIGRIMNSSGNTFYLDTDGKMMPVIENRPSRVCMVNGFIKEEYNEQPYYLNKDSVANVSVIDDIYEMLDFIYHDPFWKAQIEQIYVTEDKKFILIPKVGMHEIMFGEATHIKGKFKKLELFYQSGINRVGWEKYKMLDIQYKGQIVGIGQGEAVISFAMDSTTTNNDSITNGQTNH